MKNIRNYSTLYSKINTFNLKRRRFTGKTNTYNELRRKEMV